MDTLFGIPVGGLAVAIVALLAAVAVVLGVLALRNRIFAKLALRSAVRRRSRSALIVVGLMLATTIITSALVTGDTMSTTMRGSVIETFGATDEVVGVAGADDDALEGLVELGGTTSSYLDERLARRVVDAAAGIDEVDGAAASISEVVAVRDETSRRNEPDVMLFAADPDRYGDFSPIRSDGTEVRLADLGPGEAYVNADAADELDASPGDRLTVFAGDRAAELEVAAVVDADGAGTDGPGLLLPLASGQAVLGVGGRVENVLISNRGDETSGAAGTDAVVEALGREVADAGLSIEPVKQDGLEEADLQGNAFMALFTTFGSFSIIAGILLIFLIFLMLAAERRGELGVARAVGTRRGHLVQMFVFEGVAYDLVAAAVGVVLGVVVAFGMVTLVGQAFGEAFAIERSVRVQSLVVGYGAGVLLTLAVVTVSAWRVSVLNIVTAVRDLPEPPARTSARRRWLLAGAVIVLGVLIAAGGIGSAQAMPFMLGVSLVLLGAVLLLRSTGVPARLLYTLAGLALIVWWLLPFSVIDSLLGGEASMDFSIWLVSGVMVVLGATWVLMNNADVLLRLGMAVAARLRSLAPIVKMAGAYPLRNRFRTGVTLAMFTLVVFTLVTGAATTNSFTAALDDVERFGGGFDLRASTSPVSPVNSLEAAIGRSDALEADQFESFGSQSFVPVEARQPDATEAYAPYALRGLDRGFLETTTYGLGATADGFDTDQEVWEALRTTTGLAVVDGFAVPRRDNFGFGVLPDFQLSGFYAEDEHFAPVTVEAHHPQSGVRLELTVIGVLDDTVPYEMAGITTSADTLAPLGTAATPTTHYVGLAPGVDPAATAGTLESEFLDRGMQAEPMQEVLDEVVGTNLVFQRLVMGFMGLGLVVGVAALGVISARAVVERRQQIGVLRAVGFRPGMVRLSFLLEAAVLAASAIIVGAALGLVTAYNIIADSGSQPGWDGLRFVVPWASLALIFVVVFVAALVATYTPARRASRIYPAEALRYE